MQFVDHRLTFFNLGGLFGVGRRARRVTCGKDGIGCCFKLAPQRVFIASLQGHGLGRDLPLALQLAHLVNDIACKRIACCQLLRFCYQLFASLLCAALRGA